VRRVLAFAPGRVNLIGEHTDYNQGLALPFAIQQGVTVTAAELSRPWIEAVAADLGERDSFPIEDPPPSQGWRAFVRGTVAGLRQAGMTLVGTRVEISGTVAMGSGLGSSAALEVAVALALIGLARHPEPDRPHLAGICSRVENEWVGARTGLLDQLACLMGSENQAVQIDFRSLEVTPVSLVLGEWRLALLDSGERHANATSGYNERREECSQACELLGIESLREATLADAARLPPTLERRVRHVLAENGRVLKAVKALGHGDMLALGALIDASHASLRDLYEVSTPAIEDAVERLKEMGAAGARLVGGGFGGHVLALLPPTADSLPEMIEVRPWAGARLALVE
jgi:galactokinase